MKPLYALLFILAVLTMAAPGVATGQFKKPVYYKAGLFNFSVVSADFKHDGNLDLAVGDFDSSQAYLFLGKGNGTFHAATTFPVPAPVAMAVGDFNGDHLPDLAVLEYPGALGIYLNNGDGTFQNSANYDLEGSAARLVVADFNGDGLPDIAATVETSEQDGEVMVFLGQGDGTFGEPAIYGLPGGSGGIAASDLNGDHYPDFVITEFIAGTVAILMNDGKGNFSITETYPTCGEPRGPTIADFEHGSGPDPAVGCVQGVDVFLGNGDGTF